MELRTFTDGNLDGNDLGRDMVAYVFEHLLEVGMLLVHEGDKKHPRNTTLRGEVPYLFGSNLDAGGGTEHDERRIGCVYARLRITHEVEIAGRIDEVDLRIPPHGVGQTEVDRVLPFDFVRGVVCEGRPVRNGTVSLAAARHKGEGVNERGLAASTVANDGHVPDCISWVNAHANHLLV